ncbi:hypothetical protein BDQ17DRAFT_1327960 [Cyathus striatus]|nr:hypothetical protein BDQ17DRAFT_1327960 [Cyathus striatus]
MGIQIYERNSGYKISDTSRGGGGKKIHMWMSILVLIYIMNYTSNRAVRLNGLKKDLGLHGNQFATILAIYLVGYILMQIPSNMFLNYIQKTSLYLPGTMIAWGVISLLTRITKSCFLPWSIVTAVKMVQVRQDESKNINSLQWIVD